MKVYPDTSLDYSDQFLNKINRLMNNTNNLLVFSEKFFRRLEDEADFAKKLKKQHFQVPVEIIHLTEEKLEELSKIWKSALEKIKEE